MDPAAAERCRAWLEAPTVRRVNPSAAESLRRLAAEPAELAAHVCVLPHGTSVCFAPGRGRRVFEFDRGGTLVTALAWEEAGVLAAACVRIPDGSWVAIEPRLTVDAAWGVVDRLWHVAEPSGEVPWRGGTPLTHFAALDYARIGGIPPLAEPARLPPGAGAAVLNLVASLAVDQGRGSLRYRGPYPTERLFVALLEAFRYETTGADPLAAFLAGEVAWSPAPHERLFHPHGPYVQLRGRVEKVVAGGRIYERGDWQGGRRRAPRRVQEGADGVRCSLWFLETAIEEHLLLSPEGDVRRTLVPEPVAAAARPLPRPVWDGMSAVVAATSAPALAPFVRLAAEAIVPEWGPVRGDLVGVEGDRVRLSQRMRAALAERLGAARSRGDRLAIGLVALRELAALLGDELRARAQSLLAVRPAAEQAAALEARGARGDEAGAIAAAVDALVRDAAR